MALSKTEILDGIAALTVIELKELLDAFEEKFGVTAAAPVAVAVAGGGAAPAAAGSRQVSTAARAAHSHPLAGMARDDADNLLP